MTWQLVSSDSPPHVLYCDAIVTDATAERDATIAEHEATIAAHATTITAAEVTIAERDKMIAARDEITTAAEAMLCERDETIAERDTKIAEHVATIAKRDTTIAEHVATIVERDRTLAERDELIAVRDAELEEMRDRAKATAAKHRAALKTSKQETTDAVARGHRAIAARGELEATLVEQRETIDAHGAEIEATALSAAAAARDEVEPSLHATVGTRPACHVHQDERRRRGRAVHAERANECLRCVVENAPMLGGIRESLGRRPLVDVHTKNVVPLHPPARVGTCARKYRRHCASG